MDTYMTRWLHQKARSADGDGVEGLGGTGGPPKSGGAPASAANEGKPVAESKPAPPEHDKQKMGQCELLLALAPRMNGPNEEVWIWREPRSVEDGAEDDEEARSLHGDL